MYKPAEVIRGNVMVVEPADRKPAPSNGPKDITVIGNNNKSEFPGNWASWLIGGGSALLAHSVASTLLEKSEEEKRKQSIWSKLLSALIPLGAGAAGAYGGYRLGDYLEKNSQAKATNAWDTVIGKNKNIQIKSPPEYSKQLDELLQFIDDHPDMKWDDIRRTADEMRTYNPNPWGPIADSMDYAKWLGRGVAAGQAAYHGWQLWGTRPSVMNARFAKEMSRIPVTAPGTPAPGTPAHGTPAPGAPASGKNAPGTQVNNDPVLTKDLRDAQRVAAQDSYLRNRKTAPKRVKSSIKGLGKALATEALAELLGMGADRIGEEVGKKQRAANAANAVNNFAEALQGRWDGVEGMKPVENVSTNAPRRRVGYDGNLKALIRAYYGINL